MLQLVLDAGTVSCHSIDTSPRHIVAIFVIIEGLIFWSFFNRSSEYMVCDLITDCGFT